MEILASFHPNTESLKHLDYLDEFESEIIRQYTDYMKQNWSIVEKTKYVAIQLSDTDLLYSRRNRFLLNVIKKSPSALTCLDSVKQFIKVSYKNDLFTELSNVIIYETHSFKNDVYPTPYIKCSDFLSYSKIACMEANINKINWLKLKNGEICMLVDLG